MDGGLLRRKMQIPCDKDLSKQIFFHKPKPHKTEYSIQNRRVEKSADFLEQFFNCFKISDVKYGIFSRIYKNFCEARRVHKVKREGRTVINSRDSGRKGAGKLTSSIYSRFKGRSH